MKIHLYVIVFICFGNSAIAQHRFEGKIDTERWQSDVFLSVIDDYRTLEGIHDEQIISKTTADAEGFFQFNGNQLDPEHKIYKLHVDNCTSFNQASNHFDGHCSDSRDILFIAKHNDTISFPLSFDAQMFCDIDSSNPKTAAFIRIDSLKEDMKFAYSEFRSKANRQLNNKKWFKTLQEFGKNLDEPLAELYIYSFLSDRSNQFHAYYLEDLKHNSYYDELLDRLKEKHPNSPYTTQYETELTSDQFILNSTSQDHSSINWTYILIGLLIVSAVANLWFVFLVKNNKKQQHLEAKEQLTAQEQNVLELILDHYTNKDIAEALFISVSTVKTHINNVYKKLSVTSRDELKSLFNS
ncbi:helix-turn-helix domain-containing protein [Psychroserpens sp.]|uniref:helix-turn-helix domain-containing protein n=1 Tax=Psychroserpens sp. TaxID=2020870 RepID=UPI003C72FDCB